MRNREPPEPPFRMTRTIVHILLSMTDGEIHGYRIMQDVAERTGGKVRIGPGSLYWTLGRLVEAHMIEESATKPDPASDDTRRRYYRLTDYGRAVLASEVARLAEIVDLASRRHVIGDAGSN